MNPVRIIEIKKSVFADNNEKADELRKHLKEKKTYLINLMSSPGSGKTTMLSKVLPILAKKLKVGVMEADIDSDVDAKAIAALGIASIQLHTGGMCHLDAQMTAQGLEQPEMQGLDLIILENVGNLVCPAEFDTGAVKNMSILSVPEGDDKPLKYPLMYQVCDIVLVNKMDTLSVFDFSLDKAKERILQRNPNAVIFPLSAKTGEGVEPIAQWIIDEVENWKK